MTKSPALINIEYDNYRVVKSLLKNFKLLQSLSLSGNATATSIYIDLTVCMSSDAVTSKQRDAVTAHLINNVKLETIAKDRGVRICTVNETVNRGVKNIQKSLLEGVGHGKS